MYSEQCSCKALTAVLYPVYVNNGTNKACFPNWSHPRNLVLLYMCHHETWSCTTLKECTPKISNYIIILETCLGEWASANFYHHLKFFFLPQEPTWDTSSAFFARAAGRNPASAPTTSSTTVKNNTPVTTSQSSQSNVKNSSSQQASTEQIDPVILRSRQVAGWYL